MPMLTVIMPAWNAQKTILSAVRSTLLAMPRDSELVVYDDFSTDATRAVLSRIADGEARVRLIVGDSNRGASVARNRLIRSTDSEVVAAIDADDVCLPHRFLRLQERLADADAVFDPVVRFGMNGVRVPRPRPISEEAMPLALLVLNPLPQSTMVVRRSAIEDAGLYEGGYGQDYELWLRMAALGQRIRLRSLPTVAYRQHRAQATQRADYHELVATSPTVRRAYEDLAEYEGLQRIFSLPRADVEAFLGRRIAALGGRDRTALSSLLASRWSLPLFP